jgi:hypothetical protein
MCPRSTFIGMITAGGAMGGCAGTYEAAFLSVDTGHVVSCAETSWYRWYRRIATVVGIVGGLAILAGAAVAWNAASSVPLLVIGLGWIVVGGIFAWQGRRFIKEIAVTGATVQFVSAKGTTSVMVSDVAEFRRSRFDQGRMGTITILTTSGVRLRAVPRFDRLFDVLVALRQANPGLTVRRV